MPIIKPVTFTGPLLKAEDAYSSGVYNPSVNTTLEALNGGLSKSNIKGTPQAIEPWAMQLGSFAQGYYYGFDRMEFIYGYQCCYDDETIAGLPEQGAQRIQHAALSTKVFIPFKPSAVLYGFQAWFQHDATSHSGVGLPWSSARSNERWDWRLKLQSMTGIYEDASNALYGWLPWGRTDSAAFMPESQWRYVHKSGMITEHSTLTKGYFTIEFSMAGVLLKTQGDAKCKTVAGGVWILALR